MEVSDSQNAVEVIPRIRTESAPFELRYRSEVVRPSGKISRMELQFRQPVAHTAEFSPKTDAGSRKMVHYKRANRLNYILCGAAVVVMAGLAFVMQENGKKYFIASNSTGNSISQRHIVLVDNSYESAPPLPQKSMEEKSAASGVTAIADPVRPPAADQLLPSVTETAKVSTGKDSRDHSSDDADSVKTPAARIEPNKVSKVDVDSRTHDLMEANYVASENR